MSGRQQRVLVQPIVRGFSFRFSMIALTTAEYLFQNVIFKNLQQVLRSLRTNHLKRVY